jgi:hypothetical protein
VRIYRYYSYLRINTTVSQFGLAAPAEWMAAEGSFACHGMSKIELFHSRSYAACANLSVGLPISNDGDSGIITIDPILVMSVQKWLMGVEKVLSKKQHSSELQLHPSRTFVLASMTSSKGMLLLGAS